MSYRASIDPIPIAALASMPPLLVQGPSQTFLSELMFIYEFINPAHTQAEKQTNAHFPEYSRVYICYTGDLLPV